MEQKMEVLTDSSANNWHAQPISIGASDNGT